MRHHYWLNEFQVRVSGIMQSIADMSTVLDGYQQTSDSTHTVLQAINGKLLTSNSDGGLVYLLVNTTREVSRKVAVVGHDVEVVLNSQKLLRKHGINLAHLLDPIIVNQGHGNSITIQQSSIATFREGPVAGCPPHNLDQFGFSVPVDANILGVPHQFSIEIANDLALENYSSFGARVHLTRRPDVCPPDALYAELRKAICDRVDAEALRLASQLRPYIPTLNLSLGQPRFYSQRIDGGIRLLVRLKEPNRSRLMSRRELPSYTTARKIRLR